MSGDVTMMMKGALLGFSVAAPVGPIGVLCIRRTLAERRLIGLATGLGAAAADGVYGACAALGLTAVTQALVGAAHGRPLAGLLLVTGVVTGSAAWWLLLSGGVGLLRAKFDARAMRWVNRIAAGVIGGFGLLALGGGLLEGAR